MFPEMAAHVSTRQRENDKRGGVTEARGHIKEKLRRPKKKPRGEREQYFFAPLWLCNAVTV